MITEHASVVLTENLPAAGLVAGDVGVVVHIHRGGEGSIVKMANPVMDGNHSVPGMALFRQRIRLDQCRRVQPARYRYK